MRPPHITRSQALLAAAATTTSTLNVRPALSAPASLKALLDARDASLLTKPSSMASPVEAAWPPWMEGDWRAGLSFAGYELPSKSKIARDELFAEADVPGFKKLSIALLADVGKEGSTFPMRWAQDADGIIREDRVANMRSAVRGGLGYDAVERVDYKVDPNNPFGLGSNAGNPNRLKLVFAPGLTANAERIELFVNARETEQPAEGLFYLAESIRQVTFSAGQSRQVNGEYAHWFSYRRLSEGKVLCIVVTAVYADPLQLERLFIKVGDKKPLVVFSHGLTLSRVAPEQTTVPEV